MHPNRKSGIYCNLRALAAVLGILVIGSDAIASACTAGNPNPYVIESTPTSAFTDHGNGTVTHNLTGLMWKQCAQGLSGATCTTGTATAMTWSAALATSIADTTAGHSDWRLPNKKELESIIEFCGIGPAINQVIFPFTPASLFWSASSYALSPQLAWFVSFLVGVGKSTPKMSNSIYVRLVRGGRSLDSFDAQYATTLNPTLDVDASNTTSRYDALTDGLLIIRYLFGLTGTSLTTGALGSTAMRTDPEVIKTHLDGIRASLDIDGNGTADALTDGLLILRYMFGLRGDSLIAGAFDPLGSRNTSTTIEDHILSLMPQ